MSHPSELSGTGARGGSGGGLGGGSHGCVGRSIAQVVGVVAAVVLVVVAVRFAPRQATAVDDRPTGLINPIDQRNSMITELRELNARLARIEKRIGSDVPGEK